MSADLSRLLSSDFKQSTSIGATFLDSPKCTQLTEYIWSATNFLTAQGYWKGGLSSPSVFRTIVYLKRMFSCPRDNVDFETMKNAFAFFCVLGVKHDLDGRLNCTLLCHQLRTPNFVVLEKLAMQIVDYDMLVHCGDWAGCGSRLRGYIGAIPEQESREVVRSWMSTVELHPTPGIALKRSSCLTNEASADILLEALHAPERATYRKEKIIRPELRPGCSSGCRAWRMRVKSCSRAEQARWTTKSGFRTSDPRGHQRSAR
ncbi:hypothetical protein CPB85DRAFT_743860 [Mucidula mucida]|nr:hypothetical protein CPB85DRAFT_743860 [Mucidula mucida]